MVEVVVAGGGGHLYNSFEKCSQEKILSALIVISCPRQPAESHKHTNLSNEPLMSVVLSLFITNLQ